MGKLNTGVVTAILVAVVVVVIVWTTVSETASDVNVAAGNLSAVSNASGSCNSGNACGADTYPLTSFFKKKGVVLLALMAGIALVVIKAFLPSKK